VVFGGGFLSLYAYQTFAPKMEDARTDVYRNSKTHVEGTIRDLRDLKRQYNAAEESQKSGLKTIILHRADELDWDKLPSDLRRFLKDLDK
jgi:hypothetical protein